jgi:CRISPR-associated endonuclease/helicase Cas3
MEDFDACFTKLTGNPPFPWQHRLHHLFASGHFPEACSIPTGLGKTSVLPIWLIALAVNPDKVPRRLVYVVNRRTVVDQATREAEELRLRLDSVPELVDRLEALSATRSRLLAISTLRGQFADNAEWREDPSQPAIIVGTVDMIGSRLLFNGYGLGFRTKPAQAGLLGQDALLIHDEAHLEPAFQSLLEKIRVFQSKGKDIKPMRVTALTATQRSGDNPFRLEDEDLQNPVIRSRIEAKKTLHFHGEAVPKNVAARIGDLALSHKDSGRAILVFVTRVEDANAVAEVIRKGAGKHSSNLALLTGTLRGLERDQLAEQNPVFARFLPPGRQARVEPTTGTVYLVSNSAGEVGVNFSADHLVCDLSTLDSMAQRLGRVNRFGSGDAQIDLVHQESFSKEDLDQRRQKTLDLLKTLPKTTTGGLDASPMAISTLVAVKDAPALAFAPPPWVVPLSPEVLDGWTLTTHTEPHPLKPPVADWLHGLQPASLPETRVLWREEVEVLADKDYSPGQLTSILEDYPPKPHEILRDATYRVTRELKKIAAAHPETQAWIQDAQGDLVRGKLADLLDSRNVTIENATVYLSPFVGGLEDGLLNAKAAKNSKAKLDVADEWLDETGKPRRMRIWGDEPAPKGMILVREFDFSPENTSVGEGQEPDEPEVSQPAHMRWRWYQTRGGDSGASSWSSLTEQELDDHHHLAEKWAIRLAEALRLDEETKTALVLSAVHHDLGKKRALWQRAMGNSSYPAKLLAKSSGGRAPSSLSNYRHELGSLIDMGPGKFSDLALHLVAAHHGRCRPWFPEEQIFDPERPHGITRKTASEAADRFEHLQKLHGRWGLAYLETLLRAVDALASQPERGIPQ